MLNELLSNNNTINMNNIERILWKKGYKFNNDIFLWLNVNYSNL